MSIALGLTLAAGLLLVLAPVFWPRRRPDREARPSRMREVLAQAGLPRVEPAVVGAVGVVLGVGAGAVGQALLGVVALSVAVGVGASVAPAWAIVARARRNRAAHRVVWPDVIDQLVSAVRSGLGLPESVAALAASGPVSIRAAFSDFERNYRITGSFSLALEALKAQLADPVADRILETLRMAREVGGTDLTSVLRALGANLRQESAIRSEVAARQSWVVNAARLGVAAPWVVLVLLSTRPEAAEAYNSPSGVALVAGGLAVSVVAYLLMVRLGRLPDERRWFA